MQTNSPFFLISPLCWFTVHLDIPRKKMKRRRDLHFFPPHRITRCAPHICERFSFHHANPIQAPVAIRRGRRGSSKLPRKKTKKCHLAPPRSFPALPPGCLENRVLSLTTCNTPATRLSAHTLSFPSIIYSLRVASFSPSLQKRS